MKKEILRAENLWTDSHSAAGLKNFSMTVCGGEITGVTGLVDSGISSVAGIFSGRKRMERGALYVCGQPVELRSIAQAHEKGIYTVSEHPVLIRSLSLTENICIEEKNFRFGLSFPSKAQKRRVEKLIMELELPVSCYLPASEMPLSCSHMIEIARACYMEAKLLVLDHIAGGYTGQELAQLARLLQRLKRRGMSIVVLDSGYERLAGLADVLLVMRNGRVEAVLEGGEDQKKLVQKASLGDYRISDTRKTRFLQDENGTPLLTLEHVWGGDFQNLSFHLNHGEVLGFWEEEKGICSGLYQLLCGNVLVKEGRAMLEGKTIQMSGGQRHMIRQGIGYVEPGEKGIFPKLTLAENLTIAALERFGPGLGINGKLERAVVLDLADSLEIPRQALKQRIEKLDGNTRFLVTIYRWLLKKSKVLVLYNVLSESDVIIKDSMLRLINQVHSTQMGIILFSPNKKELYELCDRVYLLTSHTSPPSSPPPYQSPAY